MNREALRDRLTTDRKPPSKPANGLDTVLPGLRNQTGPPTSTVSGAWGTTGGKKLKEAASYLDSARKALLNWSRETCARTDNLETDAEHLQEVLGICATLRGIKTTIEFKAHLYGETT